MGLLYCTKKLAINFGAVILHKEDGKVKLIQPVSEMNYSLIEKEGLAIIFAIKKFHKYVHGKEFILQTDHRPLLAILGYKKSNTNTHCGPLTNMHYDADKLSI